MQNILINTKEKLKSNNYYSNSLSSIDKQKNGIFFTTDNKIIENIINVVDIKNIQDKLILEPSCGNGNVVIELIKKINNFYQSKKIIDKFIKNNLILNDINPNILNECISNINKLYYLIYKENIKINLNIFNIDFTKKNLPLNFKKYLNKIDYVIGNPPYITLYGRRDKKKSESDRSYFLKNYSQFPPNLKDGKINYAMLFIEHGLDFLSKNGKLSYILDGAFNETPYKYTREYILNNYVIDEIIHNISGFHNVASGQIILKITNNYQNNNLIKIIDYKSNDIYLKKSIKWINKESEYKFNFYKECNITNRIIKKIKNQTLSIKNIYPPKTIRTNTMLLNMEDKFIKKKEKYYKLKNNEYWYYIGSKSLKDKFDILKTDKILKYDKDLQNDINNSLKIKLKKEGIKNKKRIGMGDKIVFENPKLFIRQSAKQIIASFDNNLSTSNNSLYSFCLRNNSNHSINELMFVNSYLNSNIATFFSQKTNIIRYFVGKQPQIKISDLIKLPIIKDKTIKSKLSTMSIDFYNFKISKIQTLNKINNTLYKYFEFTNKEIIFIENEINSF